MTAGNDASDERRRLLIVNADDYGLTPGVCEGILRAHDAGIVTSTSALVVAPAWSTYANSLASSGLGVGAHLCAVGEDPPLLSAREVPSLVDRHGRFPMSWRGFMRRAMRGHVDADDLSREFAAQLDSIAGAGITVTHLDSHQHLHHYPLVAEVVVALALERKIGAIRIARSARRAPGAIGIRVLGRRLVHRVGAAGLVAPDASAGLDEAGRMALPRLLETIERVAAGPGRSAEIGVHPGLVDDPDRGRYAWNYWWPEELDALCHPSAREAVARHGFVLGDFADLGAQHRSREAHATT